MNTPIVRRIETILALVGGGNYLNRLHAEIAEKLRDLEDFVNSEKKDSTLTLDLKVKFTLSRDGMLRLTADHKFAEPKLPPQMGVAFLDNGDVVTHNPAQGRFDLRDVSDARGAASSDVVDVGGGYDRRYGD